MFDRHGVLSEVIYQHSAGDNMYDIKTQLVYVEVSNKLTVHNRTTTQTISSITFNHTYLFYYWVQFSL